MKGTKLVAGFLAPYLLFWTHRQMLWASVGQTLRGRHAGSVLGLAWLVVGPIILLSLYTLLYTVVFQVRPVGLSVEDYVLYIFSGLVPFIAFSQALGTGAPALAQNQGLLLNRLFPAELIPVREVLASGVFLLIGGGIILLFKFVIGGPSLAWLLLPVIMVSLAMATIGVVWGFALANLVVNDVQQIIGYLVIMLLIASPIAYTPEMVPPTLRVLLYANPFAYYVQSFQSVLVLGRIPQPEILIGCIVFALSAFHVMHWAFSVAKKVIADYV